MSLYPVLWAAEHAPIVDAEERAILIALVLKGDFDGCNCFRSYETLSRVARVDKKTAGRKCRAMEARGILRRQLDHLSKAYLRIPEEQRPVAWEVMIPAAWWSTAQLEEINEQRASLGRPALTAEHRPLLAEAPPKKARSDKGVKRPRKTAQTYPQGLEVPGGSRGLEVPTPGTDSPHPPDFKSAPQGLEVPQPSKSPSESPSETDSAPSARGAGGVRSTTASGRSARDPESGSAAPHRQRSSSETTTKAVPAQRTGDADHLSRDQITAVHAVDALIPALLAALLPYGHIPNRNRSAVLAALEARTVDQLGERIVRRWERYGYEPAIHDGELASPIGAALALIAPTPGCPDPSCEDGQLLDTGTDCRTCIERKARRRADRLTGKPPRTRKGRAPLPVCAECEHPFPGTVPADGLCRSCSQTPAAAVAALAARLAHEATERQHAENLEQEARRRRALRAAEAMPPPDTDPAPPETDQDQHEDSRLRMEILAANPWMASYAQDQRTTPPGPPPF